MNESKNWSICWLVALLLLTTASARAADQIAFWNVPEHGGNSFDVAPPSLASLRELHGYGATWVRLVPSKWKERVTKRGQPSFVEAIKQTSR